jgi:glucose-6-phosphate 1-epimerase
MSLQALDFRGQPAVRLAMPDGDSCTVALHGAHLLSWLTGDGVERIYLSPEARFDGKSAIRGGVPVCWPQFNQRGPLPKHGFARNLPWRLDSPVDGQGLDSVALALVSDAATRAIWPHDFQARLVLKLSPRALGITLGIDNPGATPWSFTAALHSYLRVDEVTAVRLEGLQGAQRWDSLTDLRSVETAPVPVFGSEFDSVFHAPAAALRLVQPSGTLQISASASCTETVVWNPGPVLAARMDDLPDDGWRHMLCVEAACIDTPVRLAPGARWQAWQNLAVVP